MCYPVVLLGAASALAAGGAIMSGQSANAQSKSLARLSNRNAEVAELHAQDALDRGEIEAGRQARVGRQRVGAQIASAAARGVEATTGSAADTAADVAAASRLDQAIIRNNAEREALGFRTQGLSFRNQAAVQRFEGQAAQTQSFFQAGSTLLSGASRAASLFQAGQLRETQRIASRRQAGIT